MDDDGYMMECMMDGGRWRMVDDRGWTMDDG